MLSPADADLVRRESVLPGMGKLLEPDVLTAMILRVLPRFEARLDINYLRYKPGQSCLIGYRLIDGDASTFVTAMAMRRDTVGKQAKSPRQPTKDSLYGPGRLVFDDSAIIVSFFPNDEQLPSLERLTESFSWRRLLTRILPERPDLWSCTWQPIRYKPQRRFVGRIMSGGVPQGSIKFYTTSGYESAQAGVQSFSVGETYQLLRLIGQSDRRHVLAFDWRPGDMLTHRMGHRDFEPASITRVGTALAELHMRPARELNQRPGPNDVNSLEAAGHWLANLLPAIATATIALADRLVLRIRDLSPRSGTIHGDFYANQVLVDDDNIGFIDFDEAHCGDAAADLGTFIAHIESNAIRGHGSPHLVEPMTQALLQGYRCRSDMPDDRVALFTATALLRLAMHPFRSREPAWPESTQAILNRASDFLDQSGRPVAMRAYEHVGVTA